MRTWKRTLVLTAAVALTLAASAETMRWDFSSEDEINDWLFIESTGSEWGRNAWEINDGLLQQTKERAVSFALFGDPNWDDYAIETRMRIDGPDDWDIMGLLFRVNFIWHDEFHAYNIALSRLLEEEDEIWLARQEAVNHGPAFGGGIMGMPPFPPFTFDVGRWYHIRLKVEDRDMELFVDDRRQFLFNRIWGGDYLRKGAVGFFSLYSQISIDYVKVEGDSVSALSVQPNGKLAAQWAQLKQD